MRRPFQLAAALALGLAVAVGGTLGWYTFEVRRQAEIDEAQPADLIVILGAAEYRGKPSPVLKARLDHGLELYQRRLASRILTTGGAGGDPDYTESGVGRDYLIEQGVPAEAILIEPEGESTLESATAAAEIMQQFHLRSCIVVTDDYHVYRAKRFLEGRGVVAYGSPRPSPPHDALDYWRLCVREAVGYFLWKVGVNV